MSKTKNQLYEGFGEISYLDNTENYDNNISNISPITLYLNEIGKYDVLTPTEEEELAKRIVKGDKEAKEKFIKSNLRLVVSVAKNFINGKLEFLDLIQEGNIGLLKAVDNFDYTKGIKFSTYATKAIRNQIISAISCKGDTIYIPIYIQEEIYKYQLTQEKFYKDNKREATDSEISEIMDVSISRINEIKSYIFNTLSLNATIFSENETELVNFLKDPNLTPEEVIELEFKKEYLYVLISSSNLSKKEEAVIKKIFDIESNEIHSLNSVAKELGFSYARVRMLEARALKKIRITAKRKFKKEFFM